MFSKIIMVFWGFVLRKESTNKPDPIVVAACYRRCDIIKEYAKIRGIGV